MKVLSKLLGQRLSFFLRGYFKVKGRLVQHPCQKLRASYNPKSRGSDAIFWCPHIPAFTRHTYKHKHTLNVQTHTHINKILTIFFFFFFFNAGL